MNHLNPKVSIIIRTLNEAPFLKPLLLSIRDQSYKNKETIIIDSGSFDGTIEIAKKYGDKLITINQKDFTFGFALNYGIKHATGDYMCIVSAHTLPKSDRWLKILVDGFNHSDLNGQIAIAYANEDSVAPARIIRDFSKENEFLKVVGLYFEGEIFPPEKYNELAKLPSKEELVTKFVVAPETKSMSWNVPGTAVMHQ